MEDRDDEGTDGVPSRSDLKLIEQALRQDWPIPPRVKREILQTLINIATGDGPAPTRADDDDDDGETDGRPSWLSAFITPDRTKIAAARVIAQYCGLVLKQQALDLARRKVEGKKGESLADLVGKAEALAEHRERTREADLPAGEVP